MQLARELKNGLPWVIFVSGGTQEHGSLGICATTTSHCAAGALPGARACKSAVHWTPHDWHHCNRKLPSSSSRDEGYHQ